MTTQTTVVVGTPTLPRVNLLPPEIAEARTLRQYRLGAAGGVLLTAVAVGTFYWHSHGGVASAQTALDTSNTHTAQLNTEKLKYAYVGQYKSLVASAQATLSTALSPQVLWSHYLQDMSVSLGGNSWFTTMVMNSTPGAAGAIVTPAGGDTPIALVTLTGKAVSHYDVAALVRALEREPGLSNVSVQSSVEDPTAIDGDHHLVIFNMQVPVSSNGKPTPTVATTATGTGLAKTPTTTPTKAAGN